nr:hypothetical protein [Tanacetum cinerariifolium]
MYPTVRVYARHRRRTHSARPKHALEHRTGMQIQTQAESAIAMTKRRHENHAVMHAVLILKSKPDIGSEMP